MSLVLQSSGGGSITIQEPATASNFTQTLPAATGTVLVSGNQPAFSAYQSSAQTLSSATVTKITLNLEEFDTNTNFDSSRFTPTVAGYYQVNMMFSASTTSNTGYVALYKNGAAFKFGQIATANALGFNASASFLVFMNGTTDYLEMYGYLSTGATTTFGTSNTIFSGCLVRGA
jgi:hypothetical protein